MSSVSARVGCIDAGTQFAIRKNMGIIDQIKDEIKSRVVGAFESEGRRSSVISGINDLLEQNGGLEGTVQKFHENGLGDVARSWVGTGKNLPLSSDQIESTFGSDTIESVARKVGVPEIVLKLGLAKLLPTIIDRLTPNGKIPNGPIDLKTAIASGIEMFGKKKAA